MNNKLNRLAKPSAPANAPINRRALPYAREAILATAANGKTMLLMSTAEVLRRAAMEEPGLAPRVYPLPANDGVYPIGNDQCDVINAMIRAGDVLACPIRGPGETWLSFVERSKAWELACYLRTLSEGQRAATVRCMRDKLAYLRGERDVMPREENYGI